MSEKQLKASLGTRMLASVERIGNKLPDPAVLFIVLLFAVWVLSWLMSYVSIAAIDPRTSQPIVINNLLSGRAFTEFLSVMVTNFSHFHPVGVVLVAMLGIGVAEHTGFITTGIRALLNVTAKWLLRYFLCRRSPPTCRYCRRFCRSFRRFLGELRAVIA
jgi:aminobenzoyl-glutamate transport protein